MAEIAKVNRSDQRFSAFEYEKNRVITSNVAIRVSKFHNISGKLSGLIWVLATGH